jgi:hypothetical protein
MGRGLGEYDVGMRSSHFTLEEGNEGGDIDFCDRNILFRERA